MRTEISIEALKRYGEHRGFVLSNDEAEQLRDTIREQERLFADLGSIDLPRAQPPERDYQWVKEDDDPNGVFLTKCNIRRRDTGPLADYDIGIKDNIAVAGVPMTCGSPVLEDHVPNRDATVVERLLSAGGRIVGKTNMDEFALGDDETTMRFRRTRNPHDERRHPGGSSLGSGVGVATGVLDIALGSDTGGSVRIPASWSGAVGLKPTRGAVPLDGFVQYAKTLDTIGVLASNVTDTARGFDVISTDGGMTGTSTSTKLVKTRAERDGFLRDITIGAPRELFGDHSEIDAKVHETIDTLEQRGASVVEVSIPHIEHSVPAWLAISTAEFGAYLDARSVPYWSESDHAFSLFEALTQGLSTAPDTLGDPIRDVWLHATAVREVFGTRHYAQARKAQELISSSVRETFSEVDVLASPTVPILPPRLEDGFGEVSTVVGNTGPFNLSGHPAISVDAGRIDDLPVGIQFVAKPHREALLFQVAACVEAI